MTSAESENEEPLRRPDAWLVLPKNAKKRGPFTIGELLSEFGYDSDESGLRIRNVADTEWVPCVRIQEIYPELTAAGLFPPSKEISSRLRNEVYERAQRLDDDFPDETHENWWQSLKTRLQRWWLGNQHQDASEEEQSELDAPCWCGSGKMHKNCHGFYSERGSAPDRRATMSSDETDRSFNTAQATPPTAVAAVGAVPPLEMKHASTEEFVKSCFDITLQEEEDPRWFSDFDELPVIDAAVSDGAHDKALRLAREGLAKYPDSFLFYGRMADVYINRGDRESADAILMEGLGRSRSKTNLCERIGSYAFERGAYMKAVRWWIISCVVQTKSETYVHYIPFLHLAYVAEGLGLSQEHEYLLNRADQISPSGAIRYDSEGADMHYAIARHLEDSDANAVREAIATLENGYQPPTEQTLESQEGLGEGHKIKLVLIVTPAEQPEGDADTRALRFIIQQIVPEALDSQSAKFAAVWNTLPTDSDFMMQQAAEVFGDLFLSLDPDKLTFTVADFGDVVGLFGTGSKMLIVKSN